MSPLFTGQIRQVTLQNETGLRRSRSKVSLISPNTASLPRDKGLAERGLDRGGWHTKHNTVTDERRRY